MQLTPRTLGMALGACLAGGLVVGVATVFSSSVGSTDPGQDSAASSPAYSEAELGDVQVTFPTPTMSLDAPTSAPNPSLAPPSSPLPTATSTIASAPPSPAPRATPTASRATKAASRSGKPEPIATHTSTPEIPTQPLVPRPKTNAASVHRSKPQPLHHWMPPHLGVGVTDISAPALSSGGRVHVTVMCTPSTACDVNGSALMINSEATRVSVTWSAQFVDRWRAWTASTSYRPRASG